MIVLVHKLDGQNIVGGNSVFNSEKIFKRSESEIKLLSITVCIAFR